EGAGAGHMVRPRASILDASVDHVSAGPGVTRAIAGQQRQGGVLEPEMAVVRRAALHCPRVSVGRLGPVLARRLAPSAKGEPHQTVTRHPGARRLCREQALLLLLPENNIS